MTITLLSYSIISLVFTTLLLGFVLAVIVISYRRILDNLYLLRQKELEMKEAAHNEGQKIIEEARHKAMEIVSSASTFAQSQAKDLEHQLSTFTTLEQKHYEEALNQVKVHTIDTVEKIATEVKTITLSDFKQLFENLEKEVQGSKVEFRSHLEAVYEKDFEQAKLELSEYKKKQLEQIDQAIKEIVKDFSIKVFGKVISYEEHEELILKALEEAKKAHVF